jgi:hypothetical protein
MLDVDVWIDDDDEVPQVQQVQEPQIVRCKRVKSSRFIPDFDW